MREFKGKEELNEILVELDKWNEKYNKCKDKYLSISCVDGSWQGSNADFVERRNIDIFITKGEMAEMRISKEEVSI